MGHPRRLVQRGCSRAGRPTDLAVAAQGRNEALEVVAGVLIDSACETLEAARRDATCVGHAPAVDLVAKARVGSRDQRRRHDEWLRIEGLNRAGVEPASLYEAQYQLRQAKARK